MLHISKEWEVLVRLTASQNSSIINCKNIYQLQFMSNSHEKPKITCNCHSYASVQSQTDSSEMTTVITLRICLPAIVHESQLCQYMYMYKTLKILQLISGDSLGAVHPSSSHKASIHPRPLIGRVSV